MNQTDTPRTNAAINASGGQWSFVLLDCSSELERELTAAREKLAKAGVGDYKADYFLGELTETGKLRSELKAVIEQRDRLAEALQGAQAALNPLSGFTKSQHQKHIDVVRDAIRAALEPFRQKP